MNTILGLTWVLVQIERTDPPTYVAVSYSMLTSQFTQNVKHARRFASKGEAEDFIKRACGDYWPHKPTPTQVDLQELDLPEILLDA